MKIPPYRIFWISIAIIFCVLAVHSFFVLSNHFLKEAPPEFLVERFDVNAEANIPTWVSTILLFSVAVASFFLHRLRTTGSLKADSPWRGFWLGFGLVYVFLSLDEAGQIHEIIDRLTTVKWVYIYAPLVGLLFLACLYYFLVIRKKDPVLRNWIIGGLVVYALGGLVCELIAYTFALPYALRQIEYVVEEGLELLGTTMVLTGCLQEINKQFAILFQEKKARVEGE